MSRNAARNRARMKGKAFSGIEEFLVWQSQPQSIAVSSVLRNQVFNFNVLSVDPIHSLFTTTSGEIDLCRRRDHPFN